MNTNEGCNESPGTRACYDSWEKSAQMERFDYTEVTETKNRSASKNKCGPPKGLSGVVKEVKLGLESVATLGALTGRIGGHVFDSQCDLCDIVLDQELCASISSIEESRCRDIAQIADKTGSEKVDETQHVLFLGRLDDGLQTLINQTIVVEPRGRILTPQIVAQDCIKL